MKLSDLVNYRMHLRKLRSELRPDHGHMFFAPLVQMVQSSTIQFPELTQALGARYDQVEQSLADLREAFDAVLSALQRDIDSMEKIYITQSYDLYDGGFAHESVEHILSRHIAVTEDMEKVVLGRLRSQSDWHRAAMIMRPGTESWIDHMVDFDPLYLVDHHTDLLSPSITRFRETYSRRLRPYVITDSMESPMLEALPDGQLGMVLAYNFFHQKPLELIRAYLRELFQKLLPGGVLAMTFNDCDRPGAVELTEKFFACYTTAGMITTLAESMGYQEHWRCELDSATTWLELKKPGSKPSLKGGQALAKIMHATRKRR